MAVFQSWSNLGVSAAFKNLLGLFCMMDHMISVFRVCIFLCISFWYCLNIFFSLKVGFLLVYTHCKRQEEWAALPFLLVFWKIKSWFGCVSILFHFHSNRVHWLQSLIYVPLPSQVTSLAVLKCWQAFFNSECLIINYIIALSRGPFQKIKDKVKG